jgi:hypothetical protein
MAYRPDSAGVGLVRDKAYPSEIAAQRPMCAPRIHCSEVPDIEASLRGGDHTESACDKFNRELRGGHAGRNDGDE